MKKYKIKQAPTTYTILYNTNYISIITVLRYTTETELNNKMQIPLTPFTFQKSTFLGYTFIHSQIIS